MSNDQIQPKAAFKAKLTLEEMEKCDWFHKPTMEVQDGHTLFYISSGYNRVDVMERQFALGASISQQMSSSRSTALHKAGFTSSLNAATFIVTHDTEHICCNVLNKGKESPLYNTFVNESGIFPHTDLVRLMMIGLKKSTLERLLQKMNSNMDMFKKQFGNSLNTFLHFAVLAENPEICDLLLKDGNCPADCVNSDGDTALSLALINKCSHTDIHCLLLEFMSTAAVKSSIEKSSYDVNNNVSDANRARRPLLYLASRTNRIDIVTMLVEDFNADPNQKELEYGSTPLLGAACKYKPKMMSILQYLCSVGADPNIANDKGETPFQFVVSSLIKNGGCETDIGRFLKDIVPTEWTTNLYKGLKCSELDGLLRLFMNSDNRVSTEYILKLLVERRETTDPTYCIRPLVGRSLVCDCVNVLAAFLSLDFEDDFFMEILVQENIKSANQPFGNISLFEAISSVNGKYLKPLMKVCYNLTDGTESQKQPLNEVPLVK